MTGQQLLEELQRLTPEQLKRDVCIDDDPNDGNAKIHAIASIQTTIFTTYLNKFVEDD